jgi:hypothetical protein
VNDAESRPTWDEFLVYLYELPSTLRPGRQRIRVVRDHLETLVRERILPTLDMDDRSLFPLGFSPAESDLKLAAGVGLERGLISAVDYEEALLADKAAGPFGFLQTLSGKTFGETVAPLIARFWLIAEERGDEFQRVKNTEFYDFWVSLEGGPKKRIEMKASTEDKPNFQQIRHPKMTNRAAELYEYDLLLCLGLSNDGLEWWIFTASDVDEFIQTGVFTPQHGGKKTDSGTYWVRLDRLKRARLAAHFSTSVRLRQSVRDIES